MDSDPDLLNHGRRMSTEERRIIEYALLWAPFGGPPADELFVYLGMSPNRFLERLDEIRAVHLDGTTESASIRWLIAVPEQSSMPGRDHMAGSRDDSRPKLFPGKMKAPVGSASYVA